MNTSPSKRRALLVLGMHRSGTSALARVLALRGAELPAQLLPANEGNRSGYWEPRRIVELNDRILASFNVAWDDPFASASVPLSEIELNFITEARAVVAEDYAAADGLLVLKDPRCTLLFDFWCEVLASLGIDVSPVVIARPPREVVGSLVRRDHTSAVNAGLLYVAYGLQAAMAARRSASFVTYDGLLGDWRSTTDRIATQQGFEWPRDTAASEIEAFLQLSNATPLASELGGGLSGWADAVWDWHSRAASGRMPDPAELEPIGSALDGLRNMFAPLLAERFQRLRASSEALAAVQGQLRLLDMRFHSEQANHRQTAAERDGALAERNDALRIYRETDARLQQTIASFQEAAAERDSALAERNEVLRVYKEADVRLQQEQAEVVALSEALDAALARQEEAWRSNADLEARLAKFIGDYQAMEAERDHLLRLYRSTDALLAKANGDYRTLEARFRDAGSSLADVRRQLAQVYASRSWRITSPIRWLGRQARRALQTWAPRLVDSGTQSVVAVPVALAAEGATSIAAKLAEPVIDSVAQLPQRTSLLRFLEEEFGEAAAGDVLSRIDRYRLPLATELVRGAASVSCSEQEAIDWAHHVSSIAHTGNEQGSSEPAVSIVIPVYNQVAFTIACIEALVAHPSRYDFEILVGDDASTDATAAALGVPIERVRHVRHAENLGFVRNCNATAALARGRYLVFLNNDTQVLPGWLDELVDTIERDPTIGLAGSKLVFPDGRLQECGAIVWRDGSAWNYGRLADPRRPEYCYLRDVDYVSGASIAVPTVLWRELGGFDEHYVPAYAEDADLAFAIRSRGLRTVVQPLSQVLHFEGVSSGTDLTSGAKAYQVENLQKLRERWADVLANHRENADSPELEKERAVRKRVLFVDHCTPTPKEDAGSVVALEVMRSFIANGYKITFIPEDNFAHVGEDTRALQRMGIEVIYHPAYSRMHAFLARRDDPFDVIFLHRFGVGDQHLDALRHRYPGARILFLNADMHHLREFREAELGGSPDALARAERTKARELRVTRRADIALVHSEFELELLRREVPETEAVLFPLIHEPAENVPSIRDRSGICFVGGFRHPPNADGICWFVEEIWPLVRDRCPDARLYIVGSNMSAEVRALSACAGIEVVGFVDDLDGFLGQRRLSIAPLRYGAGAKGKVAGSLAQGVPVVCTPIAAEGMLLRPGEDVLIGTTPEEFAGHVATLLADDGEWHRLSAAGLEFARRVTSRASATERMRRLLDD